MGVTNDEAGALDQIEHIVVLMLENRSFDSMLGYLKLDPTYAHHRVIDGLSEDMNNVHNDVTYPVYPFLDTRMSDFETPEHDGEHVDTQLSGGNGGFAKDYIESRDAERQAVAADPAHCVAMGYHTGEQLFAFDHLARNYTVCDRWFSSVRGATMPNRLYSIVGTSGGARSNKKVAGIDYPLYSYPSFVRHLTDAGATWRWYRPYRRIPSTLRLFDPEYRIGWGDNFALLRNFADDARRGDLPDVTWIDPGFFDKLDMEQSDDHPPADVTLGQRFVQRISDALMDSPCWESSLLIITYDEHGGFFDHVPPPPALDDHGETGHYGVRVPAIVVSPFVAAGVAHNLFDHTSIIRTILDRFCPGLGKNAMTARVQAAESLAGLLSEAARDPIRIPSSTFGADDVGDMDDPDSAALDDLIDNSTGGLDLIARFERRYQTGAVAQGAGVESDGPDLAGSQTPLEGRPIDDLQLGLLVAAGELARAERISTTSNL